MLSKAELKFLIQGGTGNSKHDAVMRHRIRQKLLKFQREDLPALKHNGVGTQLLDATLKITENCNDITGFRNVGENEEVPNTQQNPGLRRPGRDLNPRRRLDRPRVCRVDKSLSEFEKICKIDLQLKDSTIECHLRCVGRYLEFCKKRRDLFTTESIREFLLSLKERGLKIANYVKALRVFFREYLKSDVAEGFKIPRPVFGYVKIPSKGGLQRFYRALPDQGSRALFLFYATSGRRRNEILNLDLKDVDIERRMLSPINGGSRTKRTWFSFFNDEALRAYRKYRKKKNSQNGRLFDIAEPTVNHVFTRTSKKTGIHITPQVLRDWFCSEMGELGVADRYVDAFCGRVPRSVLARHYTDFSPERLKRIYDGAGLEVLNQSRAQTEEVRTNGT